MRTRQGWRRVQGRRDAPAPPNEWLNGEHRHETVSRDIDARRCRISVVHRSSGTGGREGALECANSSVCADLGPGSSCQITRTGNGTSQETSRGASVDGQGSREVREVTSARDAEAWTSFGPGLRLRRWLVRRRWSRLVGAEPTASREEPVCPSVVSSQHPLFSAAIHSCPETAGIETAPTRASNPATLGRSVGDRSP